jgi:hypothetical protein
MRYMVYNEDRQLRIVSLWDYPQNLICTSCNLWTYLTDYFINIPDILRLGVVAQLITQEILTLTGAAGALVTITPFTCNYAVHFKRFTDIYFLFLNINRTTRNSRSSSVGKANTLRARRWRIWFPVWEASRPALGSTNTSLQRVKEYYI